MLVWVRLVVSIREIIYRTSELIKKTIIRAWSWKLSSSSIMGDVASWNPSWNGYAIKIYRTSTYNLTLTKLCNFY